MSTKIQMKKRQNLSNQKNTNNEGEIIEIEDIPSPKKTKNSSKKKDIIENSSSEATTPYKKKQNNKKKNNDIIEIMDIDIAEPDSLHIQKKSYAPLLRQKKSMSILSSNDKIKKNDKMSLKSVTIVNSEKSPLITRKKHPKIASITLNESDEENENLNDLEINIDEPNKIDTPDKKESNKIQDSGNDQDIKIKKLSKNEKQNEKDEETISCELSSSENENEKNKDNISRKQIQKKNKRNTRTTALAEFLSNKLNSGYLSSRKIPKKKKKENERNELKSKSTIKVSRKNSEIKEKINNLLGRKRKANNNNNQKSKTPIKNPNDSEIVNNKPISQIKSSKLKSRTPFRNGQKKIFKIHNCPEIENTQKNCQSNYSIPELAVLNQLIGEYGFEKVLHSLCKSQLEQNNKLDSCLQGLKDSCGDQGKLPILLIRAIFYYFDSVYEKKKNSKKKISNSVKKVNIKKNDKPKSEIFPSKTSINEPKPLFSVIENADRNVSSSTETKNVKEEIKKEKNIKRITNVEKCKNKNNNNNKTPIKDDKKKGEKKTMSIGSHYNKTKDGKIYKYQVCRLDGKGNAIFKCYDDKCAGMGIYELESKKFLVTKEHNLNHSDHEYIINYDKDADNAFKDLIEMDKSDAQVFKENGERTVKIY